MLKPVFDGKFSKSHVFGGHFLLFFGILGVLMLNLAFLTPKRHFLIRKDIYRCISWNSPISGVGRTLVQEPPPKKCHLGLYVGCLPESDPLCKCYETWHGGSCPLCNHSDQFWSTPVNRFRCVATPKLGPAQVGIVKTRTNVAKVYTDFRRITEFDIQYCS